MYSSLHVGSPHWYQYIVPLFIFIGSLSLCLTITCLMAHGLARTINESIYIRANHPTLNSNVGKYNLYHICCGCWDTSENSTKPLLEEISCLIK